MSVRKLSTSLKVCGVLTVFHLESSKATASAPTALLSFSLKNFHAASKLYSRRGEDGGANFS